MVMSENLMCSSQKSNSKDFNNNYDRIFNRLVCNLCGRKETSPYDEGDECYCGGKFKVIKEQE